MPTSPQTIQLLRAWSDGDSSAGDQLFAHLYDELHRMARRRVAGEYRRGALETTELVHEAFLRLVDQTKVDWKDRSQFFAIAARVMRRIVVDQARNLLAEKRGSGIEPLSLTAAGAAELPTEPQDLIALDRCLDDLKNLDEEKAQLVELRFFAGLSLDETAKVLGQSRATVVRRWRVTKGWLYQQLSVEAT